MIENLTRLSLYNIPPRKRVALVRTMSHLNVVVPVVVEVEDAVELALLVDVDVLGVLDALAHRLPRVLLHLDVVELPAKK